ncbi:hypothetical protein [Bradyrhizobium sp. RDI18]|uniref:hypothetical protein n=1 Tax=Bradyrhizobium sp. RDI18 TaxID=3367400 RepID=UPI00371CB6DA
MDQPPEFRRPRGRVVPADGSETPGVTLTMVEPKDTEVIFAAKEFAVATRFRFATGSSIAEKNTEAARIRSDI